MMVDWRDTDKQCDRICEKIEELEDVDAARDFVESVREKVVSIQETIVSRQRVTPKQQAALNNMEAGVDKWFHDD